MKHLERRLNQACVTVPGQENACMANGKSFPVGKLNVVAYTPVECSKHDWMLTIQPIVRCAYFLCISKYLKGEYGEAEKEYESYAELAEKRQIADKKPATFRTDRATSYRHLLDILKEIQEDGGFQKAKSSPAIRFHKDRADDLVLMDGHRRCSVICALYGPETEVEVEQGDDSLTDADQCGNPCRN